MKRHFWVFDMDGTLTKAAHNFDAIRKKLGLPSGQPILEEIAKLPRETASRIQKKLDHIELALAHKAVAQQGAADVLGELLIRGARVGILTRNSERNAWETLKKCGLEKLFNSEDIVGRETCEPKPDPQGVQLLLSRWNAGKEEAVMVGDYLYDMIAGQAAGVATVYFDVEGEFRWREHADYCVSTFPSILELPIIPQKQPPKLFHGP